MKSISVCASLLGVLALAIRLYAQAPASAPATMPANSLATGWSLLKEGTMAEGTFDPNASHSSAPANNGHLLQFTVTKTADPGKGRVGATNSIPIDVKDGQWYDINFSAVTQAAAAPAGGTPISSVGLVFSLETAEGKVLARTTLPEIGRGRGRGAGPAWQKYLITLHASGAGVGHLVITPIEPITIWLDNMTIEQRK